MWQVTQPQMPKLVGDEQGFSLSGHGIAVEKYAWSEVGRIVAFKRDYGTYDEVYLQLDIGRRIGPLELGEQFEGFSSFVELMEKHLPGISESWWYHVAFPAYAENATTIFHRT